MMPEGSIEPHAEARQATAQSPPPPLTCAIVLFNRDLG